MSALLTAQEPSVRYQTAVKPALIEHFELLARSSSGVQHLRELVLEFALEGRLVSQNPNDEAAALLLARIQDLKAAGIANGKRRAVATSNTEWDQDAPYPVPQGWVWTTLARVGLINPRNDADDDVQASFVQMSSIPIALSETHVTEPRRWKDIKSGFTQFAEGDVGVAKITPCFENGKSTVFQNLDNGIGAGTTELHIVRPLCGINPRYVLLFLKSPRFLHGGEAVMTGTAGQKRLPRSYLENCPFPLPPLVEQTRIVTRVDELMRLCDALEAKGRLEAEQHARLLGTLLGTLTDSTTPDELAAHWQRVAAHFDLLLDRPEAVDALEQTILQLAVRGLLVHHAPNAQHGNALLRAVEADQRPIARTRGVASGRASPELDPPCELPKNWAWGRFSQVADIASDLVPPQAHQNAWQIAPDCIEKRTGRLLSRRTVRDAKVISPNHRFVAGQILYSKIRPSLSKAILVDFDGLCSADMYPISARIDSEYLLLYMLSELFLEQVATAENRVKMPKLNQDALKGFLVAVPPLEEQSRIVARVTELRRLCADLRQRLAAQQTAQSHLADALVEQALA